MRLYLDKALEELTKDNLLTSIGNGNIVELELPEIDWEAEIDKTGKLVQMIKSAIEESINYGT